MKANTQQVHQLSIQTDWDTRVKLDFYRCEMTTTVNYLYVYYKGDLIFDCPEPPLLNDNLYEKSLLYGAIAKALSVQVEDLNCLYSKESEFYE